MVQNRTCIISSGAQTAVGLDAKSTAAAVRAGISGFEEHPFITNPQGEPYSLAMVPDIDPYTEYHQRLIGMATAAINEAIDVLNQQSMQKSIPVIMGLPEKRPGNTGEFSIRIEKSIQDISPISIKCVESILKGHSAGLIALEKAHRIIATQSVEFCLVGGVDSYIESETLEWLEKNEQIHQPINAWGFIPGEAACFCLVCSKETAKKYNLEIQAELLAISTQNEQNKIKTESINLGEGLTQAVRDVTQMLPAGSKLDYMICDQNGEAYRADEFGFMLTRLSEIFNEPSNYMTPADCWGDVGAASGPLFINQVCAAIQRGYEKGLYTLLWTSSEGGERTAAIFTGKKE
jgi:3-oxoacyl-[acyl-carrier-protein] synthase-1